MNHIEFKKTIKRIAQEENIPVSKLYLKMYWLYSLNNIVPFIDVINRKYAQGLSLQEINSLTILNNYLTAFLDRLKS